MCHQRNIDLENLIPGGRVLSKIEHQPEECNGDLADALDYTSSPAKSVIRSG